MDSASEVLCTAPSWTALQSPFVHVEPAQPCPQRPQFAASLRVSVSQPGEVEQSAKPVVQEATAHVPLESHWAVAFGSEHVAPVFGVVPQLLLPQLAVKHVFVGVGQSVAPTHSTQTPAPTQTGALEGHVESFCDCPSDEHVCAVLESLQLDALATHWSHCLPASSHRLCVHGATVSKPLCAALHFSRVSPLQ
jgi:hypothetical protein